jgi:hypothetical protein
MPTPIRPSGFNWRRLAPSGSTAATLGRSNYYPVKFSSGGSLRSAKLPSRRLGRPVRNVDANGVLPVFSGQLLLCRRGGREHRNLDHVQGHACRDTGDADPASCRLRCVVLDACLEGFGSTSV